MTEFGIAAITSTGLMSLTTMRTDTEFSVQNSSANNCKKRGRGVRI